MARPPRVDIAGEIYHVINRANNRQTIFALDKDYLLFEDLLLEAKELIGMDILSYCLMPNHWHLVLRPTQDGYLASYMKWLTLTHTKRYHSIHNSVGYGHIYQGRYKSFIVQKDSHLLQLVRYVERNPVRAKLVEKGELWRWSSLWRRVSGSIKQKQLLANLPIELPNNYLGWVNEKEGKTNLLSLRQSVNKGTPFGGEEWISQTVDLYNLDATLRKPGRQKKV